MKAKNIFFILTIVTLISSCGFSSKPSDTIEKLASIDGDMQKAKKYYTKKTVALLEEIEKFSPQGTPQNSQKFNNFNKDVKWEVVEEKVDGDTAVIKVKITNHTDPQFNGMVNTINMLKEDGMWKMDMQKELEPAVGMMKNANKMMNGMGDMMKNFGDMMKNQANENN